MNASNQIATVDFHGTPIIAIKNGDQIHVAMKPICEAIGLDWKSQYDRIKRHHVMSKGMVIMAIPSQGGEQQAATLPLKMLNGWLFGIDTNRVKEESRARLIQYQTECFDVLADYFLKGEAINPRMQYTANPGDTLTKDQADQLRDTLTEAAKARYPDDTRKQAGFLIRGWSKLKAHFKVGYRKIPQIELPEALNLLARHIAEPELLDAAPPEPKPAPQNTVLTDIDALATEANAQITAIARLSIFALQKAEQPPLADLTGALKAIWEISETVQGNIQHMTETA
jgi:hypothetical protein